MNWLRCVQGEDLPVQLLCSTLSMSIYLLPITVKLVDNYSKVLQWIAM